MPFTNDTTVAKPPKNPVVERRELDLSRAEDLDLFLESAEDVFADAMEYRGSANAEGYRSLSFDDISGEEVFTSLYELLAELQAQIEKCQACITEQKEVSDQTVESMQTLYNNMVLLRDLILETYAGAAVVSVAVTDEERILEARQEATLARKAEESEADQKAQEVERSFTIIEKVIRSGERHMEAVRARVLNRFSPNIRDGSEREEWEELDACSGRLMGLIDRVRQAREEVKDIEVLKKTIEKYSQVVADIIAMADALEKRLVEKAAMQSPVISQPAPERVPAAVIPQDHQRTKGADVTVEGLPSDADVTALYKRITGDQFYTEAERKLVRDVCESLHREVAMGGPPSVILQRFEELKQCVEQMERSPDIAELSDRAHRILQRVTAGLPYDHEVLRTTRSLEQVFKEAVRAGEEQAEEARTAYRTLERYVRSHELEWLSICGCRVPEAGSAGVSAARRLREVLLIERDRNQDFVRDPKKQMLADKLVRKLSQIPKEGFTVEKDITEIVDLMRAIDVTCQQGSLPPSPAPVSPPANEPRKEEKPVMLGTDAPTHKVMNIRGEATEANVSIVVAEKTKARLAKQAEPKHRSGKKVTSGAQLVSSFAPRSERKMAAGLEQRDPINVAVPARRPTIVSPRPEHTKRSLTAQYLTDPVYQAFIHEHYTSPKAFERLLDTTIAQIEAKTMDVFERWLQEEYASPFSFLQDMTVDEVVKLGNDREVRAILSKQNIKYESFLVWLDLVDEMQAVIGNDPQMKFAELYACWMIETEMWYRTPQVDT